MGDRDKVVCARVVTVRETTGSGNAVLSTDVLSELGLACTMDEDKRSARVHGASSSEAIANRNIIKDNALLYVKNGKAQMNAR